MCIQLYCTKKFDQHFVYDTFFTFLLAGKIFCTSLQCALFRYFRDKLSHRPAEMSTFELIGLQQGDKSLRRSMDPLTFSFTYSTKDLSL